MFFFQISMVLMIVTYFQNGEPVNSSSRQTLIDQYNNLLNLDTGYLNDDMKKINNEEITEITVTEAKGKVYSNLLCSYVFTCRYYMTVIEYLVYEAEEDVLMDAFTEDILAIYFQIIVGNMLFILQNGHPVNSFDLLWLMYAYVECLTNVCFWPELTKEKLLSSDLIKYEHEDIYKSLAQFTVDNCSTYNMYNHEYDGSKYYTQFELNKTKFPDIVARSKMMLNDIFVSTNNRNKIISQSLGIDIGRDLVIDDLRFRQVMIDYTMEMLLEDFAEAVNGEGTYEIFDKHCSTHPRQFQTVKFLVEDVGGCLKIFVNLMKYIIARNTMKYVLHVHSTLPLSENGVQRLRTTNEKMLSLYKEIISYLKIDEDEKLKFIAELFASDPEFAFNDLQKNTENENRMKELLEEYSIQLNIGDFRSIESSRDVLDPSFSWNILTGNSFFLHNSLVLRITCKMYCTVLNFCSVQ